MNKISPSPEPTDKEHLNSLTYWYPILKEIRMRVPETLIVHRGECDLLHLIDGKEPDGYKQFEKRLLDAMREIGFPCFLRTGMMSSKHEWGQTCFVADVENMKERIFNLVAASCLANIAGDPICYDFWVVRKMIPTTPLTTAFNNMPIAMEVRAFIKDGKFQCIHPYWVKESLEGKPKEEVDKLQILPEKDTEVYEMIDYIAKHFSGYWSVDFLQDKDGNFWCIDMATGERSFHDASCKFNSAS